MLEVVTPTLTFAAGALVAWLVLLARARSQHAVLREKVSSAETQLASGVAQIESLSLQLRQAVEGQRSEVERRAAAEVVAQRVPALDAKVVDRERMIAEQGAELAKLETRLAAERKAADERLAFVDEAQRKLGDAFKALSSDALKSNNTSFLELAQSTLQRFQQGAKGELEARQKAVDDLVKPLRESLERVDGKLGDLERVRISAYASLNEQLKGLVETQLPRLQSETANLVKALRQPTVRGRWGEIQLKRVVEMAGMVDHCDFVEQPSRRHEDGQLRPDLIVNLPGGKRIVVDAKAPIAAYLDAVEAQDEATQRTRLADHARQVRTHITALGRKAYWEQFNPSPEFVVLFLPGETFFSAALNEDPALIEFGVNEMVIPATPTTLIALLRAVAYGWRQEALAQNAQEVAELGKLLYERIAKLAEHWVEVGDRLGKAVDSYNRSVSTLESRVLVTARRLRDLKAAPEGVELEKMEPVERIPRELQAVEFALPRAERGE